MRHAVGTVVSIHNDCSVKVQVLGVFTAVVNRQAVHGDFEWDSLVSMCQSMLILFDGSLVYLSYEPP